MPFVLALALTFGATDWPPPRLLVLAPELDPLATRHLDPMAKASLQASVLAAVEKAVTTCVISPRDLRDLRMASASTQLCGVPVVEALDNRYALRSAVTFDTQRWQLTASLVDVKSARIAAQLTLTRQSTSTLESDLPGMFAALTRVMAAPPVVSAELKGVLKEGEISPCAPSERGVDVEARVTWSSADSWLVNEVGAQKAGELSRERALDALKRGTLQQGLEGAFVWTLAQLGDGEKEIIADRPAPFDQWSKREVLQQPGRWITSEHALPMSDPGAAREAVLARRLCVTMDALRAAVSARVRLIDPASKPRLVVLASSEPLMRALETLAQRYGFGPAGAHVQTQPLDLGSNTQRVWLKRVMAEAGAEGVLWAQASESTPVAGKVPVSIDVRLLDGEAGERKRRVFQAQASPRGSQPAIHEVATAWASGYPAELEAWILSW